MALTTDFAGITPADKRAEHGQDYSRYRIVPARHPGRRAGTIFATLIIAAMLYSTFTNPRWGWGVFGEWFFAEPVLVGLGRTLLLTVLAAISGSILRWRWHASPSRRCSPACPGVISGCSDRSR
jgi:polar amino acid transport system permease protein